MVPALLNTDNLDLANLLDRHPIPRTGDLQYAIVDFLLSYTRLTAHLVHFDIETLRKARRLGDGCSGMPELFSPMYLAKVTHIGRFHDPLLYTSYEDDFCLDPEGRILEWIEANFTFKIHTEVCSLIGSLVPRFPRLIEALVQFCNLSSSIAREAQFRAENIERSTTHARMQNQLVESHEFFKAASGLLSEVVDKHISGLSADTSTLLIRYLTEIYQASLHCNDDEMAGLKHSFQANAPGVHPLDLPEVIAYKWRFDMWVKLMRSSQMQLRVNTVSKMCDDLVNFWKRNNDAYVEDVRKGILEFFATYLLRSGIIEYILGPTCHPEIISVAANIVGFLAITHTFTNELSDLFWQTVTNAQDPRVSDAVIRMMNKIIELFAAEVFVYLAHKIEQLPLKAFTLPMREFCMHVFKWLKMNDDSDSACGPNYPPFAVSLRLLRESSVPPFEYPDVQAWAGDRFREQISTIAGKAESRRSVIELCLEYIEQDPDTSLGSLWGMNAVLGQAQYTDLAHLPRALQIPGTLVKELENAIQRSRGTASPGVLAPPACRARKDILQNMILKLPHCIDQALASRLWVALVGNGASCQEDRIIAWFMLNNLVRKTSFDNSFLRLCCTDFLPELEAPHFCAGSLDFVLKWVVPRAKMCDTQGLEDPDDLCFRGIEQVWRMILQCPADSIEAAATKALVKDVYIDNPALLSFQPERVRKIHQRLVNRCLGQLKSAAHKVKSFSDNIWSGEDETMAIVAADKQILEQEVIFIRSLALLREFMEAYQTRPEFSSPDLRALMPESPDDVRGDSAGLKYQSFDGNKQTDVMPLQVGRRNTAASLLASLKEATGFENYRIFYKGKAFEPSEKDICKSLEDLKIRDGLILVKRIADPASPTIKARPGVSSLEMEVLSHFPELWEYLSMGEMFAQEVLSPPCITQIAPKSHNAN